MIPATFSNSVTSGRRAVPPPEVATRSRRVRAQGHEYRSALGLSDAPRHTRIRRMVQRAFTPRALSWMDPVVAQIAAELVDALPTDRPVELVEALARPLPIYAICRILGLPDGWRNDITRWSDAATASLGSGALPPERFVEIEHTMLDYQRTIVPEFQRRRDEPRDDLLSVLVAPDEEYASLSDTELIWLVRELLVAGNETTTKLITDLVLRLHALPAEWDRLRSDPSHAFGVVEEGLRMASPVQGLFRRVTRDTVLGGVALAEGATIFVSFASANRDESLFDDADTFSPDRAGPASILRSVRASTPASARRSPGWRACSCCANWHSASNVSTCRPVRGAAHRSFVLRGITELPVRAYRR